MMRKILPGGLFFSLVLPLILNGQTGVVIHDRAATDDCYRLISSRNLEAAHLITPEGRYIHSWRYPSLEAPSRAESAFGMSWHYAEMRPDGHLLAIIKDEKIIELDWNGRLVWQAGLRAHHDFARTRDGRTLVVSRRDRPHPWAAGETIALDELVEFDARGNIVWTWRYEEHVDEIERFVRQPLPPLSEFRDWPHINTCEVLPESPAGRRDERFRAGNLLLCGRHANTIFVVDRKTGEVVWAWGPGELEGPHMPTMLNSGRILIYDNGHHRDEGRRGWTRVIELDPLTGRIAWQYAGDPPESFYSPSRGSAERLKNGNTLIAESDSGRLFEITPKGTVVWEFWNPDLLSGGRRMALYRTVPYDRDIVVPLLERYGRVRDVDPGHLETLKFRELGLDLQYKQYIREVVFWTEIGYLDHALAFLDRFMRTFPEDPEGRFGYAVVFSARGNPARAFDHMRMALDAGLPPERFSAGLDGLLSPLLRSRAFQDFIGSRSPALVHGPLLGAVTSRSARIWVRTHGPRTVRVNAFLPGTDTEAVRSREERTNPVREHTAVLHLENLEPDTTYRYTLTLDGRELEPAYRLRTYPDPGRPVHLLTGFGGGAGYTPRHERMWDTLTSFQMPFFLLLGDNVYIDHPERPAVQKYCYYRRQSRPEFRRFTAGTAVYAVWDDHDFTHDDGRGGPDPDKPAWKRDVWRVFRNQWNNPSYGGGETHPGCWTRFSFGDIDFFLLDGRYYREDPESRSAPSMLGARQKAWLLEGLKDSRATFKVIASPVPWAKNTKPGSLDTWDGHPGEREEIFRFIEDNRIKGVILLSADRHRSDAWRIPRPGAYDLYDLESSKLTNVHTHKILPGALFGYNAGCSAGLLEFDTTVDDPWVKFRIVDIDGREKHSLTLPLSRLSFREK